MGRRRYRWDSARCRSTRLPSRMVAGVPPPTSQAHSTATLGPWRPRHARATRSACAIPSPDRRTRRRPRRSEEHTSELQSHSDLVCRLLLEKKKKKEENSIVTTRNYYKQDVIARGDARDRTAT